MERNEMIMGCVTSFSGFFSIFHKKKIPSRVGCGAFLPRSRTSRQVCFCTCFTALMVDLAGSNDGWLRYLKSLQPSFFFSSFLSFLAQVRRGNLFEKATAHCVSGHQYSTCVRPLLPLSLPGVSHKKKKIIILSIFSSSKITFDARYNHLFQVILESTFKL